jgi:glycosyltransferase involved in cell wall biosynthesis
MEKISVIIPAYLPDKKYIKYLEKAVESVKCQTIKNINLIVVFNGPISFDIPSTTTIKLDYKTSAAICRNIGAALSIESKYFCFLDADDFFSPTKLEKQLELAESKNLDFVFTEATRVDSENNQCGKYNFLNNAYKNDEIKNILHRENILITSSCFIKKESFLKTGMFPPTNEYNLVGNPAHHNNKNCIYEDYLCWINAINKGYKFEKLNEELTYFRINTSVER